MNLTSLAPRPIRTALYPWKQMLLETMATSRGEQPGARIVECARMLRLYGQVRGHTMVSPERIRGLYRLAHSIDRRRVPGDIVECGVCNGGTAATMAAAAKPSPFRRKIWLFDSFEGLPIPTERDGERAQADYRPGWCLGSPEQVREVLDHVGFPDDRIELLKGWFEQTIPTADIGQIALLHIDADWYESVKLCLERLYDAVQPGGYIVLDDYGYWEGCRVATDEFVATRCLDVELLKIDRDGYYFEKPAG